MKLQKPFRQEKAKPVRERPAEKPDHRLTKGRATLLRQSSGSAAQKTKPKRFKILERCGRAFERRLPRFSRCVATIENSVATDTLSHPAPHLNVLEQNSIIDGSDSTHSSPTLLSPPSNLASPTLNNSAPPNSPIFLDHNGSVARSQCVTKQPASTKPFKESPIRSAYHKIEPKESQGINIDNVGDGQTFTSRPLSMEYHQQELQKREADIRAQADDELQALKHRLNKEIKSRVAAERTLKSFKEDENKDLRILMLRGRLADSMETMRLEMEEMISTRDWTISRRESEICVLEQKLSHQSEYFENAIKKLEHESDHGLEKAFKQLLAVEAEREEVVKQCNWWYDRTADLRVQINSLHDDMQVSFDKKLADYEKTIVQLTNSNRVLSARNAALQETTSMGHHARTCIAVELEEKQIRIEELKKKVSEQDNENLGLHMELAEYQKKGNVDKHLWETVRDLTALAVRLSKDHSTWDPEEFATKVFHWQKEAQRTYSELEDLEQNRAKLAREEAYLNTKAEELEKMRVLPVPDMLRLRQSERIIRHIRNTQPGVWDAYINMVCKVPGCEYVETHFDDESENERSAEGCFGESISGASEMF